MSKKFKLSEIANIKMGQSPSGDTCNDIGNGIPLLNGPAEFTSYYPVPKQYTIDGKRFSDKGEILFCVRGSTTGRMNWGDQKYALGRGLASISHKNGNEYNHFLKFLLQSNLKSLLNAANGSTFPNLTSDILASFELSVPEEKIQKTISFFLQSIDSKIELNNRINAELEAMAKTFYDYWFVQFEFPCLPKNYKFSGAGKPTNFESCLTYRQVGGLPVPDEKKWFVYVLLCEDGSFYKGMTNDLYRRYYEHHTGQGAEHTKAHQPQKVIHWEIFSSQSEAASREKELKTGFGRTWLQREYEYLINHKPGLPAHNARPSKLMPAGKMVWNEELKREIPEGWEVEGIEKNCSIVDCLHSKKSELVFEDVNSFLLQLENIKDDGIIDLSSKYYVSKEEYQRWTSRIEVKENDILITNAGRVAATAQLPKDVVSGIGRNITAIRPTKICPTYLFLSFRGVDIKRQIRLNTDSGAFFTSFNVKGIKKLQILRPKNKIEEKFEELVIPIRHKRELNNIENQKLTELRDWLLPMLMNGQVRVN